MYSLHRNFPTDGGKESLEYMRACLDSVIEKVPPGFQERGAAAPRTPVAVLDKPFSLTTIAAVHAKLKVVLGKLARVNRRWDELVREYTVLQAIIKKVRLVPWVGRGRVGCVRGTLGLAAGVTGVIEARYVACAWRPGRHACPHARVCALRLVAGVPHAQARQDEVGLQAAHDGQDAPHA